MQQNNGFALLLTLIVVSVVLALGLSLLDVTLKQLVLSGTGRDSEISFHAAYAGVECGEYWARQSQSTLLGGAAPTLTVCLNGSVSGSYSSPVTNVHLATYSMSWGSNDRCTEIDMYVFDAVTEGSNLTYNIPNFKNKTCNDGTICTAVISRGYNRNCTEKNTSIGTIQREITSEF